MKPMQEWLTQSNGLADQLRAMRVAAGLPGKELAARLGWFAPKVSRLENGRTKPSPEDVTAWAQACSAPEQAGQLIAMLGELTAAHQQWRKRMRAGQAAVQDGYTQRVAAVRHMCDFEVAVVPGLLQTPAYARHILTEMRRLHNLDVDDVDQAVAARLQRQQHLYDDSKQFEFLLAEPVLRWGVCPPAVMRAQLDRLAMAADLPNVRFGILPLDRPLPVALTPQNSFALYDGVAVVESFTAETTCGDEESARYGTILLRLWDNAVEGDTARQLIAGILAHLPQE